HLLEAIFSVLDDPTPVSESHIGVLSREIGHIKHIDGTDVTLHLYSDLSGTLQVSFFGEQRWKQVDIRNSYSMFRDNLIEFIRSVGEGVPRLDFGKTCQLMHVIISANESRLRGGERILL